MLPTGVGEVIWRIIPKYVTRVTKQSLEPASNYKYAMYSIFDTNDTKAMLLIDASNAFNSLNWAAALHNPPVLCSVSHYTPRDHRRDTD